MYLELDLLKTRGIERNIVSRVEFRNGIMKKKIKGLFHRFIKNLVVGSETGLHLEV